jgi:hypothetical protein
VISISTTRPRIVVLAGRCVPARRAEGAATPVHVDWVYAGRQSPNPGTGTAPVGGDRDGGRTDPSRERGRHFDNVRGSGSDR